MNCFDVWNLLCEFIDVWIVLGCSGVSLLICEVFNFGLVYVRVWDVIY